MEPAQFPPARIAGDIFSGAGLGLLLGALVGLSGSPVVAGVIGGLTSLLAVFLGLKSDPEGARKLPTANALRIGAFGFATVLGLVFGLQARVNDTFSEPPSVKLAKWQAVFPDDPVLVKQMVIFDQTGLEPAVLHLGDAGATPVEVKSGAAKEKQTMLFSTLNGYDACSMLHPDELPTEAAVLRRYRQGEAPEFLVGVADQLSTMDDNDLRPAMLAVHSVLCGIQQAEVRK